MPLRIPHKGKNKGKYISFHYLRGWKARKIRKVQEISPQIKIYGGVISGGGSTYAIGDGRGQTHCEVSVYGGSCYSSNSGKTLLGATVPTDGEYEGKTVEVKSLSGIQSVTVDGIDQRISSFVISDCKSVDNVTVNKRVALNLFMTKADSHVVVVTDTEGVEHTYEF